MKKMKLLAVAAIAGAAVGTGAYVSVERSNGVIASDVVLANVEALADSESSGGYTGCKSGSGYCAIYVGGECIFSSYSHYPY